jgi:hypothetical protein
VNPQSQSSVKKRRASDIGYRELDKLGVNYVEIPKIVGLIKQHLDAMDLKKAK